LNLIYAENLLGFFYPAPFDVKSNEIELILTFLLFYNYVK